MTLLLEGEAVELGLKTCEALRECDNVCAPAGVEEDVMEAIESRRSSDCTGVTAPGTTALGAKMELTLRDVSMGDTLRFDSRGEGPGLRLGVARPTRLPGGPAGGSMAVEVGASESGDRFGEPATLTAKLR